MRYAHSQLEVIGWLDASFDPRYRGTEEEFRSEYPRVFQPIIAVIGREELVKLDLESEDENGIDGEIVAVRANAVSDSERGDCLLLNEPLPVRYNHIGFVDADSDEQKYVPWNEAVERINAFVSEMRPKGDEAYRAGNREAAGEIYAKLVSASHLANDLARCILVEDNDGIRQTFIELLRTSYERLLGHPSSEEGLTEFIEGVRAEIIAAGAASNSEGTTCSTREP